MRYRTEGSAASMPAERSAGLVRCRSLRVRNAFHALPGGHSQKLVADGLAVRFKGRRTSASRSSPCATPTRTSGRRYDVGRRLQAHGHDLRGLKAGGDGALVIEKALGRRAADAGHPQRCQSPWAPARGSRARLRPRARGGSSVAGRAVRGRRVVLLPWQQLLVELLLVHRRRRGAGVSAGARASLRPCKACKRQAGRARDATRTRRARRARASRGAPRCSQAGMLDAIVIGSGPAGSACARARPRAPAGGGARARRHRAVLGVLRRVLGRGLLCRALGGLRRRRPPASTRGDPGAPRLRRALRATRSAAPARSIRSGSRPRAATLRRAAAGAAHRGHPSALLERRRRRRHRRRARRRLCADVGAAQGGRRAGQRRGSEGHRRARSRSALHGPRAGAAARAPTGNRARPPHARARRRSPQRVACAVDEPVRGPRVETHARCEVARIVARLEAATAWRRPTAAPLRRRWSLWLRGPRDADAAAPQPRRDGAERARGWGATSATTSRATRRGRWRVRRTVCAPRRPACRATRR